MRYENTLIEVKSKADLIINLCGLIGKEIVLHYICLDCDNDQVTYCDEFTYDDLEQFIENNYLMLNYECTDCGSVLKFLEPKNITAIEVWDS